MKWIPGSFTVLDLLSLRKVRDVQAGRGTEAITASPDGEKIHEIDVSSVGGHVPVTLLFSPDGSRLWVATTQAARVIEIDTEDWTISRVLKAGAGSDGLGYSGISGTP